jgi:hypothetical protein
VDDSHAKERLSQITTLWSLLRQAQGVSAADPLCAQHALMDRYYGAAYRYLLGATRNEEAALELFQDFAVRFLRGDFRRADPERGRFRDYADGPHPPGHDYRRAGRLRPRPCPMAPKSPINRPGRTEFYPQLARS